jgi:hypothetical protein
MRKGAQLWSENEIKKRNGGSYMCEPTAGIENYFED